MPTPPTPTAPLRPLARWRLRRQVRKALRRGTAERHRATLALMRARVVGKPVTEVDDGRLTELRFDGGATVTVGRVHEPTLHRLRAATRAGGAWLVRVADHGGCWGLYFSTTQGVLPVLAGELRVLVSGGRERPATA